MMAKNMEGFDDVSSPKEPSENDIKKKRGIKKGGGFQAMGLSFPLLKGIKKRGYKIPTPIQRKTIPVVLQGRDIVAMARTGSGKTACFLIPLFEKLLNSAKKSGARALILSPTRELALQTLKFVKEIGRFMNLKSAVILGGDSMDNQFAAIHGNPDIIVATPGRFLHICVEMELKLQGVQYVVFDEADRLFEMGFSEQLRDIVKRLPESRQTLLFSATLPKVLVEFAKAGLSDPVLIRLDVESKLPEKLDLAFVSCRSEEKCATILCLLKYVIPPGSQTVLFAATRHHVEYLHMILDKANIPNAYIYSSLDPSARKIGAAKFQTGKVPVLIVTDVAARGLDIPQLDFVINYNFPAKPKLFVHRVGRCARAGRSGTAYSLVSSDEFPYLLDLHLFLGRPVQLEGEGTAVVGTVPQNLLEEEQSELVIWHDSFVDLANMKMVCSNAYKQYLRSRPGASVESVRRAKEMKLTNLKNHSIFDQENEKSEVFKNDLLNQMKRYRPVGTIFEIGRSCTSDVYTVMKSARQKHKNSIANHKRKLEDMKKVEEDIPERITLAASSTDEIRETFQDMIIPKKYNMKAVYHQKKKIKTTNVDKEHFVPYKAVDHHTEQGLQVNNFQIEANKMQLDLTADNEEALKLHRRLMHWDRKKKKMVGTEESKVPKIRTEAGTWIPATFKTKRYAQWKERNKVDENEDASDDSGNDEGDKNSQARKAFLNKKFPNTHWGRHNEKLQQKIKSELRRPEQILKMRKEKERRRARSNRPKRKNKKKQ